MNPLTITKNQNAMNERELRLGYTGTESSWHRQYKDSAWIFVGGLNFDLTEGDVVCVFSQYGEVANLNLVRDKDTGKSKGFAFVCYENQKSTVLATDNLNGIKLGGRVIRVDHVEKYKVPRVGIMRIGKEDADQMPPEETSEAGEISVNEFVREYGCGPEVMQKIARLQKAAAEKQKLKAIQKPEPSPPRRQCDNSPSRRLKEELKCSPFSPPTVHEDLHSSQERRRYPSPSRHIRHHQVVSRDRKRSPLSPPRRQGCNSSLPRHRRSSSSVSPRRNHDARRHQYSNRLNVTQDSRSSPSKYRRSLDTMSEKRLDAPKHQHRHSSSRSPSRRRQDIPKDRRRNNPSTSPTRHRQDKFMSPSFSSRHQEQRRLPSVSPPRRARLLPPPSPPRRKQRSPFS